MRMPAHAMFNLEMQALKLTWHFVQQHFNDANHNSYEDRIKPLPN
jgi:hypothetical protein